MVDFLPFIIILMILAAFLRQDAVLIIFYFIIGVFFVGRFWSCRSLNNLSYVRKFSTRAFLNQTIPITLTLSNRGWLPIPWLQIHESLPVALIVPSFYQQVISLGSHDQLSINYTLKANKRGYYLVGPIFFSTGDLLGMTKNDEKAGDAEYVTVYPKIVPLPQITLPSRSPFGTIHHKNPIYEDTSRTMGKRDYQVGDPIKRIDWKATAVARKMQVRLYEASISIETSIFLDLHADDYDIRHRYLATELAIVVAASIASWTIERKQSVGLYTNGLDPLTDNKLPHPLTTHSGSLHLMNILDILARIQAGESISLIDLLHQSMAHLAWGSTMVLITGRYDRALLTELFGARKSGLSVVIILSGEIEEFQQAKIEANRFGFPIYRFTNEADLEAWQL